MKTLEEQLQDLNLYINKLKRIVMNESSFSLGNTRIVSRARIDDVICCMQASYPKDYTDFVKRNGTKKLQTYLCFQQLLAVSTKKFVLSSGHYSVDYAKFMSVINTLVQTMTREMKMVIEDSSFKL